MMPIWSYIILVHSALINMLVLPNKFLLFDYVHMPAHFTTQWKVLVVFWEQDQRNKYALAKLLWLYSPSSHVDERLCSFFPSWFRLCSIGCGIHKSHKAQKTTGGSIERAGATDCRLRAWLNCTRIISLRHFHACIQVFIFVMVFAGHPTAVCRTSACGYCHREWYDGVTGRIINCTGTLTDRSVCVWVRLSVCLCLCMRRGSRVQQR